MVKPETPHRLVRFTEKSVVIVKERTPIFPGKVEKTSLEAKFDVVCHSEAEMYSACRNSRTFILFGQSNSGKTFTTTRLIENVTHEIENGCSVGIRAIEWGILGFKVLCGNDKSTYALNIDMIEPKKVTKELILIEYKNISKKRQACETLLNKKCSSRSHLIVQIHVSDVVYTFVDCAGSEATQDIFDVKEIP